MATDTTTTSSTLEDLWDKFTDGLTAASDGVSRFLTRLFGASNERYVRKLGYIPSNDPARPPIITPGSILAQVNDLEEKTKALSDDELRQTTPRLREKLSQGATLDDLLPEAFAACREAGRRAKNMRHFDVQILGGVVLHRGNIAEMVTGEGKTLVATLPAFLNGLEAGGVHIVTVNDYLARRDCEWMLPIYRAVGLNAGYIQSDQDPVEKRKAYDCDVTYGTNSEFGFDYLRDNMKPARWNDPHYPPWMQQCQRTPLNYAIIDEVDNILVDEARTPLIISGPAFSDVRRYGKANEIAVQLAELQKQSPGRYFEVKEKEHTCHLTDEGIRMAEELAGVESFYTAGNMEWPHLVDNALKAHHLYHKDKRYAVMRHPESGDMSIIIIDEFTGRLMMGRQWSDGLHQAVEAKHAREGVKIKEETQTLATVTIQNFFKLYRKLAGMTGTAMTEANEFWKIYHLEVIAIPTNKPLIRVNHQDVIFRTEKEKWKAVIEEVAEVNKTGRPILIGTVDVDKSLKLSEMLKRRGIKHELLNALPEHAAREAEIVAQAGRMHAVTISTNMAGRGTDIILGGNPETLAWAQLKNKYATRLDVPAEEWQAVVEDIAAETREVREIGFCGNMREEGRKVAEMGGMHIVGTERHEARRIDNQLRGRAGRQGDPGSSRFYLSLQDDLMRIFAGEWVANMLTRLGMEEDQAIESGMVSRRVEAAQKKVEERNFDIRKNLLEYDEVMDQQRKSVYGFRQEVLEGANCKLRILAMIDGQIELAVGRFTDEDYGPASFAEFAAGRLGVEFDAAAFVRSSFEEADKTAHNKAVRQIQTQVQEALEENLGADDPKEWNWKALSDAVNKRWGLKTTDRQFRQMGKDNLSTWIIAEAETAVAAVDLSPGATFLEPTWNLKSLCDWARAKFGLKLEPGGLAGKSEADLRALLHEQVMALYRQKEIEFPVKVGMARFMAERAGTQQAGGQRYDREGLYHWARQRFPGVADLINEEAFRTESRARLQQVLLEASRKAYPQVNEEAINAKVEDAFSGTKTSEAEDAKELAEWARSALGVDVTEADLTGVTPEQARSLLWNAFDARYRPEMRTMERSLALSQLDQSWKNHLYTMDHLRSSIGLRGMGQMDPKIEYKREGMQEFKSMWEGVHDKVTDSVFRMEEADDFQESAVWTISSARHDSAPRSMAAGQDGMTTNAAGDKKPEPIRNRGDKVGRNDPCPCGSGKKYKNCHMRATG
ncbi:MAG TPA: preprotein translocase subunit SecA [Gemmataceae bacterium]|nr:preprotein translocase subunit SecA [Gemmataceae bacterium]